MLSSKLLHRNLTRFCLKGLTLVLTIIGGTFFHTQRHVKCMPFTRDVSRNNKVCYELFLFLCSHICMNINIYYCRTLSMPNYTLKYSLMRRMCQHTTVSVKQQFTTCKGIKQQYSIPNLSL